MPQGAWIKSNRSEWNPINCFDLESRSRLTHNNNNWFVANQVNSYNLMPWIESFHISQDLPPICVCVCVWFFVVPGQEKTFSPHTMRFRYSFPRGVWVFICVRLFVAFLCAGRRMQRKLSCCIVAAAVDAAAIVISWSWGFGDRDQG